MEMHGEGHGKAVTSGAGDGGGDAIKPDGFEPAVQESV